MNHKLWLSLVIGASGLLLAASSAGAPAPVDAAVAQGGLATPPAAPQAPADTPYTLLYSGVTSYTIADPKIFWYHLPVCTNPPPKAPTVTLHETISRMPTYGGSIRTLFQHPVNSLCPSGQDVNSNIVSDGSNVYWISSLDAGLVKLSVNANAGDKPAVVNSTYGGLSQIVLAQGAMFVLTGGNSALSTINLTTGVFTALAVPGTGSTDFQTDNTYLYWNKGGTLHQWDIAAAKENSTIASGVTGYYPANAALYYGKGKYLYQFDKTHRTSVLIYTSTYANSRVYSLRYDGTHLFWFEDHTLPLCGGCLFPNHDDWLFRSGAGGGSPTQIYVFHANLNPQASDLRGAGDYLFWLENGALQRLPKDAATLPKINLVADSLEMTQGIQDLANDVPLIQGRDTYVRFYVHSAGAAVPGVTAYLYRTNSGGTIIDGPLPPANPAGQLLTVLPSPNRNNLNDSFLFELPWDWVGGSSLYLRAVLNPFQDPLEPNYADNTLNSSALALQPSPRLEEWFISWGYTLKGKTYYPRYTKDMVQTWSWLRRAYPLASVPGVYTDLTPGLRTNWWSAYDAGLGARVNQTAPECTKNTCASSYVNTLMIAMRTEDGIPTNVHLYGMMSDAAGFFPAGLAAGGGHFVGSGPAGIPSGGYSWDTDGSYADFYAGHEIGHTVGRGHPASSANPVCDHQSAQDYSFPYAKGQIGPNSGVLEGFDVGDSSLGLPLAVYPGASWHDVMSYCVNRWISDYGYNLMYNFMIAHPTTPAAQSGSAPARSALAGNWLAVYGQIVTGPGGAILTHVPGFQAAATSAILTRVRHVSAVATLPPLVAGPYSIELFDAGNGQLASYPFTPDPATGDAPNWLNFTQVVTDIANTAQLRIVRLADSAVLATEAIPAHTPTVGNLSLTGPINPVTGTVTLQWAAGDVDGNPLTFDLFYSRDGGATVQPLQLNLTSRSAAIDTLPLGGGTALLRVVASDGVNTAQADSAPFTMANKPPQPMILAPGEGAHRHWGQLVNFSGQALDAQDGGVDPSQLVWSDQKGVLGTGALLSISNLPVGTHVITLKATDSLNLSANTSIVVVVDDDLNLPGPTLSVGPQQFAWSFDTSADAVQTDTLALDNVGGGSLSWTASTDAPWLKLGAASGTAPSQITLTANPTGLAANMGLSGHIFLNVPAGAGSPAQQVVVPVSIGVALDPENPPALVPEQFLPFVTR